MSKADRAAQSARALLDLGDADGARNRAYYAMFDAARAVLLAADVEASGRIARTHKGVLNAFSALAVKGGPTATALGRHLKRAEEVRILADSTGESITEHEARRIVDTAEAFVVAVRVWVSDGTPPT